MNFESTKNHPWAFFSPQLMKAFQRLLTQTVPPNPDRIPSRAEDPQPQPAMCFQGGFASFSR
jgi:hypothetical protein